MQSAQLRLQSLEVKREPAGGARPHILFLAAYSAVLFVITIPIAKARLLWNDELFTLSVARHSFHEIWQVLRSGADQMPVVLAGKAGGAMQPGRILDFLDKGNENRRACSLYLSMLDRMGVKLDRFGDTDKRLPGLFA